jgi:hypothetical protein
MKPRRLISDPRLRRGHRIGSNGDAGRGLGRVKTLCEKHRFRALARGTEVLSGFDHALIAAISGWMPMMFIMRVRL